jgi:hypothetical protein
VELDSSLFPNAAYLQDPENIGDLEISTVDSDIDNDGDIDVLYMLGMPFQHSNKTHHHIIIIIITITFKHLSNDAMTSWITNL